MLRMILTIFARRKLEKLMTEEASKLDEAIELARQEKAALERLQASHEAYLKEKRARAWA